MNYSANLDVSKEIDGREADPLTGNNVWQKAFAE